MLTIDSYIRQQATLLVIEAEARAKTEALQVEARLSDGYPRQSTHEAVLDDSKSGTRIAGPRSSVYSGPSVMLGDEYGHHRDTTILENGMIVERFDVKRGERDRRREGKKASKSSTSTTRDYLPPMTPSGGQMEFAGSGSDYEPPHPAMSSTSLQQSRPTSAPLAVPGPFASNLSVDGRSPRFMGSKHWQAPWSSAASQAPTGSMVDMQYALLLLLCLECCSNPRPASDWIKSMIYKWASLGLPVPSVGTMPCPHLVFRQRRVISSGLTPQTP